MNLNKIKEFFIYKTFSRNIFQIRFGKNWYYTYTLGLRSYFQMQCDCRTCRCFFSAFEIKCVQEHSIHLFLQHLLFRSLILQQIPAEIANFTRYFNGSCNEQIQYVLYGFGTEKVPIFYNFSSPLSWNHFLVLL